MSLIAKIISKFDDSGIKKAKHSFSGLEKALGAVGIGLGLKEVADLLLESAKAASVDEKSMLLLNTQLQRNAHATKDQIKQSNKFVEKLSLQTGIVKDKLRPAYARFANVTHNVKDAQRLLTIAVDASAGSGLSQTRIVKAVSQAYTGNQKALAKLFPELKNSKNALGDLSKEYAGMAALKADPFMKFNNSIEILKEKLGTAILPLISEFVDYISKPGGVVDQVGAFFDSLNDPKSDAGKMFTDIKNAVKDAFGQVRDFFALFGNGDAMKGFGNLVKLLIEALPAFIALKGILALSAAGKPIKYLLTAITAMKAGTSTSTDAEKSLENAGNSPIGGTVKLLAATQAAAFFAYKGAQSGINEQLQKNGQRVSLIAAGASGSMAIPTGRATKGNSLGLFDNPTTTNVTINVQSADPKAVVDALGKYVKSNGALPKFITAHLGGHP